MLAASSVIAGIASIQILAPQACAQESNWTNQFGGNFGDFVNWDNGVPMAGVDAVFGLSATYNVGSNGDHIFQSFLQTDGNVTFNGNDRMLALGFGQFVRGGLTVEGTGTTLEISNNFDIGSSILGTATVNINSGAQVSSADAFVGLNNGNAGEINVDGAGSLWRSSNLYLGTTDGVTNAGIGHITVTNGGLLGISSTPIASTNSSRIVVQGSTASDGNLYVRNGSTISVGQGSMVLAEQTGTEGRILIDGADSRIDGVSSLLIGVQGNGQLTIQNGAVVSADSSNTLSGSQSGSSIQVSGVGSALEIAQSMRVSSGGSLTINDGGSVNASDALVGNGGLGIGLIQGSGSTMQVTENLTVGKYDRGELQVEQAALVVAREAFLGDQAGTGIASVTGVGSALQVSELLRIGNGSSSQGALLVEDGGFVTSTNTSIRHGQVQINGPGSQLEVLGDLDVSQGGPAELSIDNGGLLTSKNSQLRNSSMLVNINGADSRWVNSGSLAIGSEFGDATLTVTDGGFLASSIVSVGDSGGLSGKLEVAGVGTELQTNSLFVGISGNANLRIASGASVSSTTATLGQNSSSTAVAIVTGSGSQWDNTDDFSIGGTEASQLKISDNGIVSVGGVTTVSEQASVDLNDGRFEFGTTDLDSFNRMGGTSGSLAGNVDLTGYNHVSTLTPPTQNGIDVSEVSMRNSGVIYGEGVSRVALINTDTGEVRTLSNQSTRFSGTGNTNSGEINNFGGLIEFENDFLNKEQGFVGGRGQFIAGGGTTNLGVIAFTAGEADILGDFANIDSGRVVSSGGSVTTFFDDVVHNGAEIRTAEGSQTVFLGQFSGSGAFTGVGDVFFEGDLRPGNSPDIVRFEGDVHFGGNALTNIELAGLAAGEFDQLVIDGDLTLDGLLSVDLIEGFSLGSAQEFIILDVEGDVSGQFHGLSEGDLVGSYGTHDLFISYSAGNGNDVALFTSVPEPSSVCFAIMLGIGGLLRRQRSVRTRQS